MNRFNSYGVYFFAFLVISFQGVLAGEFDRIGNNFRSLGMGNTGISSANGSESLYYNPATLANIHLQTWDIVAADAQVSTKGVNLYEQVAREQKALESTTDKETFVVESLKNQYYFSSRVESSLNFHLGRRGFTLGVGYADQLVARVSPRDQALSAIKLELINYKILQVGVSVPFKKGEYVIGFAGRNVKKIYGDLTYTKADATANKQLPNLALSGVSGSGNSFDVGFLYRHPSKWRWRMALVAQNIGGIDYGKTEIPKQPQEISAGFSMVPVFGRWRYEFALDYRDIEQNLGTNDDKDTIRRIHAGTEISYFPVQKTFSLLALRLGYNQGHPTYGAEFIFGYRLNLSLGYANYTEEVGTSEKKEASQRSSIYLSFFTSI